MDGAAPVLIVTRPLREARVWVDALRQHGLDARAHPLMDIAAVDDAAGQAALAQARAQMDACAAIMFVSANAVEGLLAPGVPLPQVPCWCTGPGTAAALRARGVPPGQIVSPPASAGQFDSEALWAQVDPSALAGRTVLIVRGDVRGDVQGDQRGGDGATADGAGAVDGQAAGVGRDWLAAQLAAAGAQVRFVVAYRRVVPVHDAATLAALRALSDAGAVWLFSSSEALRALPDAAFGAGARALATHPRIAQAAAARGLRTHSCRPTVDDVVRSIESFA